MKSTQQYIDIPSWAAGLAGETGNEIPALLQRSQSSQSETEQKCQKSTFACAQHILLDSFFQKADLHFLTFGFLLNQVFTCLKGSWWS